MHPHHLLSIHEVAKVSFAALTLLIISVKPPTPKSKPYLAVFAKNLLFPKRCSQGAYLAATPDLWIAPAPPIALPLRMKKGTTKLDISLIA